jgi:ABC-2 type transport system permease protein
VAGQVVPATRLGTLWESRGILSLLVFRDLKVKYSDSVLGYLWSILDPLAMAGVYWFVFTRLMNRQIGESPYIVFLLCAMLPWQWTNHSMRSSMKALSKDSKLVRSTSLPREIWVLRTVGAKGVEFLLSIPVLIFFAITAHAVPTGHVLYFPLALAIQLVLLTGLGLLLAPISVLYGDVERIVTVVMRLLFYLSPIIYGTNDIEKRFGHTVARLYDLNPLAGIFDLYRSAFFPNQLVGWHAVASAAAVSVAVFVLGALTFRRLEGAVLKEI